MMHSLPSLSRNALVIRHRKLMVLTNHGRQTKERNEVKKLYKKVNITILHSVVAGTIIASDKK